MGVHSMPPGFSLIVSTMSFKKGSDRIFQCLCQRPFIMHILENRLLGKTYLNHFFLKQYPDEVVLYLKQKSYHVSLLWTVWLYLLWCLCQILLLWAVKPVPKQLRLSESLICWTVSLSMSHARKTSLSRTFTEPQGWKGTYRISGSSVTVSTSQRKHLRSRLPTHHSVGLTRFPSEPFPRCPHQFNKGFKSYCYLYFLF